MSNPDPSSGVDAGLTLTYESRDWAPRGGGDGGGMSRRARMAARGPYQAAVLPEIAEHRFQIAAGLLSEAEDALMEIARFDSELAASPLGDSGELAPLAAILLRTESASSSQIENVTAGAKALAMAAIHEQAGPNAQMVAANVEAMERAVAARWRS